MSDVLPTGHTRDISPMPNVGSFSGPITADEDTCNMSTSVVRQISDLAKAIYNKNLEQQILNDLTYFTLDKLY